VSGEEERRPLAEPAAASMNRVWWGPPGLDGERLACCWSCGYQGVAILFRRQYKTHPHFVNRARRHPVEDLPWWGPSPKAIQRAVGRGYHSDDMVLRAALVSRRFARGRSFMKPPVVITCYCGADNRVEIAGLEV
jgi:hypothetical protein